jgi:hypothetical protein
MSGFPQNHYAFDRAPKAARPRRSNTSFCILKNYIITVYILQQQAFPVRNYNPP